MGEPATILIVDDHRAVREELAFALGYDGWATSLKPATAADRRDLAAADPRLALVLLDVKLPGLDGLEVLSRLKEARPDLPVVMISRPRRPRHRRARGAPRRLRLPAEAVHGGPRAVVDPQRPGRRRLQRDNAQPAPGGAG
jgi:CheY-like chemotaxis protein